MRDIAKKILKQLDEEKISNEPLPLLRSLRDSKEITAVMTLNKAREAVHMLTLAHQMVAPNLTASAALTFAGYGLGQELCERFALEYVVTTKKQDVSLIFLNNKTGDSTKGCVFIFMGNINAPQNLFISQGGSDDTALRKMVFTYKHLLITTKILDFLFFHNQAT